MPKKIDPKKEENIRQMQKLLKAALIIDVHLASKEKGITLQDQPKFECELQFAKSVAREPLHQIVKKLHYEGMRREYDYATRSYVDRIGLISVWCRFPCGQLVSKYIREHDSSRDLGCYTQDNRTVRLTTITAEDLEWAKVVLKNSSIDISTLPVEDHKCTITFTKTFSKTITYVTYVTDATAGQAVADSIISGEKEVSFPAESFRLINASKVKGTELTCQSVILEG